MSLHIRFTIPAEEYIQLQTGRKVVKIQTIAKALKGMFEYRNIVNWLNLPNLLKGFLK